MNQQFERENRYIVIKRSDLEKVPVSYRSSLVDPMFSLFSHLPRRKFLVIESDWPEYEQYWQRIECRVARQASEPETLATLVLGGAFDSTELGDNDIQVDQKLIEALQQRLVKGTDDVHIELVDRAVLDRVTAERDALQLLLNERDEQVHSLEQRRQAEQQACQAAEREAVRYHFLRKVTPYRFKKMQDTATTDGGDVFYFHADRFDAAIDALLNK